MSFLSKLFGKKLDPSPAPLLTPPPVSPPPDGAPATMKVWDDYGRICEIPREEWRTKVLPHNFQTNWNKPDDLANLIHSALNDGFIPDCLEPARQLQRIDSQPKRGATFLSVILLQLKKFDEAEKAVTDAMRQHGEDGMLLTNLVVWQALDAGNDVRIPCSEIPARAPFGIITLDLLRAASTPSHRLHRARRVDLKT